MSAVDLGEAGSMSSKGFFIRRTDRNGESGGTPLSVVGRLICEVKYSGCSGRPLLGTNDGQLGRRLIFNDGIDDGGVRGDLQPLWAIGLGLVSQEDWTILPAHESFADLES